MKISKEEMVKAVMTEPLGWGEFVDDNNCAVCAVGAVLRRAGVPPESIDYVARDMVEDEDFGADGVDDRWTTEEVRLFAEEIAERNPLAGLSYLHEGLPICSDEFDRDGHRVQLACFIEANMPAEIEIEYDDADRGETGDVE